jgi:hypothetical protein
VSSHYDGHVAPAISENFSRKSRRFGATDAAALRLWGSLSHRLLERRPGDATHVVHHETDRVVVGLS